MQKASPTISFELDTLRTRSRNAINNSSIANAACNQFVNLMCGEGLKVKWNTGDSSLDEKIGELFEISSYELDSSGAFGLGGLQQMITRSYFQDGEIFIRYRKRKEKDGLLVPLQVELLEGDYLNANMKFAPDGSKRNVNAGIALSPIGKREGYYFYKQHPLATHDIKNLGHTYVKAIEVDHIFHAVRPNGLRGVPILAPILNELTQLSLYSESELIRKNNQSMYNIFVTEDGLEGECANKNDRLSEINPGTLIYLSPGQDVKFPQLPMDANYPQYLKAHHQQIAAGIGISYSDLLNDYNGANYSSLRSERISKIRKVNAYQKNVLWVQFLRPLVRRWLQAAVNAGLIDASPKLGKFSFIAPAFEPLDEYKSIRSDIAAIRAGVKSRTQVTEERGISINELDRMLVTERNAESVNELIFDSDAAKTAANGSPFEVKENGWDDE